MINIESEAAGEVQLLDFNIQTKAGKRHVITLPVLGEGNIPLGMMATVSIAQDAIASGDTKDQARALYGLLESMKGQFPDEYRLLWSMDFETALKFFEAWFSASSESGFDPKA